MILDATAPHTRVDNFVIDEYADKIGAYGLAIYTVIKRHLNWMTGQCNPSYNRIAEICGINRSTVIRYVKRLKSFGLIDPQMRFTDDGQTSNQYGFYQPKRPKKPAPAPAQTDTTTQTDTTEQMSPPVAESNPPSRPEPPDQVDLNKREEKRNAKDMPEEEKTGLLKVEKKKCNHPESEIVRPCNEVAICTNCYTQIE